MNEQEMQELLKADAEPLCDELKRHFVDSVENIPMIAHPLVHVIALGPNGWFNRALKVKRQGIIGLARNKKWSRIVWHYEKPYRVACLRRFAERIIRDEGIEVFRESLMGVWSNVENLWQHKDDIPPLIKLARIESTLFDEDEGREDWAKRKDWEPIKIYRGCTLINRIGYSWTVDYCKAEWFARRFMRASDYGLVLETKIKKPDVLFYLTGRNEREVVVKPGVVFDGKRSVKTHVLKPMRRSKT